MIPDNELLRLAGGGYEAALLPRRGANCILLRHTASGCDVLRTPQSLADFANGSPFLYGMPPLFFPNRIAGGRFQFEERSYRFPINEPRTGCHLHGTLHETPFVVTSRQNDTATLQYTATRERPYGAFPHAFRIEVTCRLGENGLRQDFIATNQSGQAMPFALGCHTTFRLPFAPDEDARALRLQLEGTQEYERDDRMLPTGRRTPFCAEGWRPGKAISALVKRAGPGPMRLGRAGGPQVVYEADPRFTCWMVYGNAAGGFLCVEPQTWVTNAPNLPLLPEDGGLLTIQPGKSVVLTTRLRVEA